MSSPRSRTRDQGVRISHIVEHTHAMAEKSVIGISHEQARIGKSSFREHCSLLPSYARMRAVKIDECSARNCATIPKFPLPLPSRSVKESAHAVTQQHIHGWCRDDRDTVSQMRFLPDGNIAVWRMSTDSRSAAGEPE